MWISKKNYEDLRHNVRVGERNRDTFIRICSGLVCSMGGSVTIPVPSIDRRTLTWKCDDKGNMTITSRVYGAEDVEMSMSGEGET